MIWMFVPACFADPAVTTEPAIPAAPTVSAAVSAAASTTVPPAALTCPSGVPAAWAQDPRASSGRLIVVFKAEFQLGLYEDGQLVSLDGSPACFPIAMGRTPEGPKMRMDHASTPEGWYRVSSKRDIGQTSFHRGFYLDYPNEADISRSLAAGVITAATAASLRADRAAGRLPSQNTALGGDILIHGSGAWPRDWTWGCVAMNNEDIDRIFSRVKAGDDVLILPWAG